MCYFVLDSLLLLYVFFDPHSVKILAWKNVHHRYIYIYFKSWHIGMVFLLSFVLLGLCFMVCLIQVIPCALLALVVHPSTSHNFVNRISWAFCVYLEAVSVLPQLRVMQNAKVQSKTQCHYYLLSFNYELDPACICNFFSII